MTMFPYPGTFLPPGGSGMGNVFFVHGFNGLNTNEGVDPAFPLQTITYALTLCVAGHNDYIIVLDAWSEDTPIVVNKSRVHIIGLGCYGVPLVTLTSNADSAIFQIDGDNGDFCEIAGFDLGGGNNHAGIEPSPGVATADLVYIHHCNFGSEYCGDTPQDGIGLYAVHGAKAWLIEKCKFFGASDTGGGQLTADGVVIAEGAKHEIKDCVFLGCPGVAINVTGQAIIIRNNEIALDADTAGAGITLGAGATRCLVSYNKAAFGEALAALNNPYVDNAGANANAWTANYDHETSGPPA